MTKTAIDNKNHLMDLLKQLEPLSKDTSYPATEIQILAQQFIEDQTALAQVVGYSEDELFAANGDLDDLGFTNSPFGIKPRPAIWFQLAIGAFVENVIGPKKDEPLAAGDGANAGKTAEDAYITTIVDFKSLDYPNFSQSSYPTFAIRESSLSPEEKTKLIENLRGLYERWEFSKLYYASIQKINPFNNLLDQICVVLARLDSSALPSSKIFPDHQPEILTFSPDDLFFSGEGNEYYPPNAWFGWKRDEAGEVTESYYVSHGEAETFKNQGVRYLDSHNNYDPLWGKTGYVPSTGNIVMVDSFYAGPSS